MFCDSITTTLAAVTAPFLFSAPPFALTRSTQAVAGSSSPSDRIYSPVLSLVASHGPSVSTYCTCMREFLLEATILETLSYDFKAINGYLSVGKGLQTLKCSLGAANFNLHGFSIRRATRGSSGQRLFTKDNAACLNLIKNCRS